MKYLLLVHHDEEAFGKMSEAKRKEMLAESVELTHQLHANEQYVHASPLHPAATAAVVRVREGKPFVTDGPFMETKEQLACYFLSMLRTSTRQSASPLGFLGRGSEPSKSDL